MATPENPDPGATPGAGAGAPRLKGLERRVTELAADQVGLRRDLAELAGRHSESATAVRDLTGALSEALPRVDTLGDHLAEVRGQVAALAQQAAAATPKVTAVCWPALSADQAEAVWQALGGWVADVLGPFYRITRGELPDCWAAHPDAVLELVWLHACYRDAYTDTARPGAAAEWHARWRRDALANIAAAIPTRLCRPGGHLVAARDADTAREHEQTRQRAYAGGPGWAPAAPAPGAAGGRGSYQPPPPGPQPVDPEQQVRYDPAADDVTTPARWGHHYNQAMAADLAWRRAREHDREENEGQR